jgi:hypothetical protein
MAVRVIKCEPYDLTWWDSRRGVPSTSDFGNIITPKKQEFAAAARGYAIQLIADKFDGNYGPQSEFQTQAMREGHRMEPEARNYYEFHHDCELTPVGFVLSDCGRFGSTPDSLVGDEGLLEIKNPTAKVQVDYLLDGGLPAEYAPQAHGQLIVTGRQWVDFLSYSPGLPKLLVRVTPNEFTEKLRGYLEQFWTLYQDLLGKIEAQRNEAIAEAIDRKGDQMDEKKDKGLRSFLNLGDVA